MTFREAIRKALDEEMTKNKDVVLMGEDVGIYGGCFKVSEGLFKKHPDQVIDTPVSEEGFTGLAVGSSMMGLRPVVEVMYADFYTLIFDPIVNHAAKTHFMSGGQFSSPITIRLPEGSGTGHGAQHTQSPEALFMNTAGLKIVSPSNPNDAYHLLKEAINDNNPVLFFEHKMLYDMDGEISSKPLKIGKAKVVEKGSDLTIISYSRAVQTAVETSRLLKKAGISASVVDLCTLKPLDEETIKKEIQRTGRCVVIQDPSCFGSVASQIVALAASDRDTFCSLKSEILAIGGKETPVPFSKTLEKESVPSEEYCFERILELFNC